MSVVDVVGELSPPGIKNKVYSKAKCDKAQVVFNFFFFFFGGGGGERQGIMGMGSRPPPPPPPGASGQGVQTSRLQSFPPWLPPIPLFNCEILSIVG